VARAAVFFAAAVRAAAGDRFGATFDAVRSSSAFFSGSTTTSAVGAAFSAADFAVVFVAGFFGVAGFEVAGFAGVRLPAGFLAAVVFAGDVRLDFFGAGAAPDVGSITGSGFVDAFGGTVSVSSTSAARSSGEEVTVLRYQWVAGCQCRRARIGRRSTDPT
jgi:hypothetical protein